MKVYLEARQSTPDGDFIREDITSLSDAEIAVRRAAIDAIMVDSQPYKVYRHECHHPGGSCPPLMEA